MIPFSSFLEQTLALAFPEGEAENLATLNRSRVVNALIHLQTYITCLRDHNVSYFLPQDMTDFCGASIFTGPRGEVQSIYSFFPTKECNTYHHRMVSSDYVQCVANACCGDETALPYDADEEPYINFAVNGTYLCADATGTQNLTYESQDKVFNIGPGNRWIVAPKLPCGYVLVVHWQGIKRTWANTDLIVNDEDLMSIVAKWVVSESSRYDDGDLVMAQNIRQEYDRMGADMHNRCREETRVRESHVCLGGMDNVTGVFQALPYDDVPGGVILPPTSTAVTQIYTGSLPAPTPDDPTSPALFYPTGGGSLLQWDTSSQQWV